MSNTSKPAAVPGRPVIAKGKVIRQAREGSRRGAMDSLEIGESVIFLTEPGDKASKLQAGITSLYRNGESMSQQGLEQHSGMLIFEGEYPLAVVRVTRVHDPK